MAWLRDRGAGTVTSDAAGGPAAGGSAAAPVATLLVESLVRLGVTDVLGIPDNGSAAVFAACEAHPQLRTLLPTREGEAFAVAAGLWLGGRCPVVLVQNTGLLESGDALRGTVTRMGVPLLCLVGFRGAATLARAGQMPPQALDHDLLTRPDVDSVAMLTEATLRAWDLPVWHHADDEATQQVLPAAWSQAHEQSRPVVVLLHRGFA